MQINNLATYKFMSSLSIYIIMISCCCHLSQSIDLNALKSSVGKVADYEKKLGQGIQVANNYLGSNNLPKLSRRQLQSKLMQGVQSYGQQQQPMQQQQQQSQQQQPQQQYYSSNMMMKRQMGGKMSQNSQQPMSAYSQYSNSYGAQSGYGQPIGQSQMMKRQYQSKLAQAYYPSQQGQPQQQQQLQQYGYPPIKPHMQIGGINLQPQQLPYLQQPQYYDNIGFDENQQDSYEPVDGPYVYDDNVEEPVMGDVVKRELM